MAADVRPVELADLLDVAERPRATGWSLRAALVRYAQPEPQRASDLIELARRVESALKPSGKVLERDGPAVWDALVAGGAGGAYDDERLLALLEALVVLDGVGARLSAWAADVAASPRPDDAVDRGLADVSARLAALGVQREERPRPSGARRRG